MLLKVNAPLDPGFMPMAVVYRDFEAKVKAEGGQPLPSDLKEMTDLPPFILSRYSRTVPATTRKTTNLLKE